MVGIGHLNNNPEHMLSVWWMILAKLTHLAKCQNQEPGVTTKLIL